MGAMVTIVVVAALIAGSVAYWLVGRGDGGGLPDTLAGQPRSESEFADAMEGMMSGFDSSGVDVDVAFYGEAQIPSYMVMLMSGPGLGGAAGTDLFDAMPSGVMQAASGAEIDFSQALTEERGGVSFACVPVTSTQGGINQDLAMCLFGSDEDTVGLVMSLTGENLSAVMDATTELAESLD